MKELVTVLLLAASAFAQYPATLTVHQALNSGGLSGPNATNLPVTVGVPLKDGDVSGSGESQMGLTGSTIGQFRCIGFWASGNCQWMLVDAQIASYTGSSYPSPGNTSLAYNVSGSGNFGGSAMATQDANAITVDTGVAQFTLKRNGNFNLFDSVTVNGVQMVAPGNASGLQLFGPDLTKTVPSAPANPTLGYAPGGTLAARTYYVEISYSSLSGETLPSSVVSINVPANNLLTVTSPVTGANVNGYYVYASNASGNVALQNRVPLPIGTNFTEPASCPYTNDCRGGTNLLNFTRFPLMWAGSNDGCTPGATNSCTTAYSSNNDTTSTCAIAEDNGPVRSVVKCDGWYKNATGTGYLEYTLYFHFFRNHSDLKAEWLLRNARKPNQNTNPEFASDTKGFNSASIVIVPTIAGAKSFAFGTHTSPITGTLSGEDAYLYQAESTSLVRHEFNTTPTPQGSDGGPIPPIFRYPNSAGYDGVTYLQSGYMVKDGVTIRQYTEQQYPEGWADLSGLNGAGITTGVYHLSAYWPKSLELRNVSGSNYKVIIGLDPDQTQWTDATTAQPYYQAWPHYQWETVYINFHSATNNPSNDFGAFDRYAVARAPLANYNNAKVFGPGWEIPDPVKEDNYAKSLSMISGCTSGQCLGDQPDQAMRWYVTGAAGAGNQHEWRWSMMRNFLARGLTGRWLFGVDAYRWQVQNMFPRSDGFYFPDAYNHLQVDKWGFPQVPTTGGRTAGAFPIGNYPLANRNWAEDDAHHVLWGGGDAYFMAGNDIYKQYMLYGEANSDNNPTVDTITVPSYYGLSATRAVGSKLQTNARLHKFFRSINDASRMSASETILDLVLEAYVFPDLYISGFGSPAPTSTCLNDTRGNGPGYALAALSCPQGISRARGVNYMGYYGEGGDDPGKCPARLNGNCGGTRAHQSLFDGYLTEGLWETGNEMGPAWTHNGKDMYHETLDLMNGTALQFLQEDWIDTGNYLTSGTPYISVIDWYESDKTYYMAHGNSQTNWFNFAANGLYNGGDLSAWRTQFEEYYKRTAHDQGGGYNTIEMSSHMQNAAINLILAVNDGNPPPALIDVPVTATPVGTPPTYWTLQWTEPANTLSYRMKYRDDGKAIVDSLKFDTLNDQFGTPGCKTGEIPATEWTYPTWAASGCWGVDPTTHFPFFGSPNLTNLPGPTGAGVKTCDANGTSSTCTIPGYDSSKSYTFSIKALVTSVSQEPLHVVVTGAGSGTVTSSPGGISCPLTCDANFMQGIPVRLTASPATGSIFGGWSGDCSGTGYCDLTMDAAHSVTATFNLSGSSSTTTFSGVKMSGVKVQQ